MSSQKVREAVARLLTDEAFAAEFAADRTAALAAYNLSPEEIALVQGLDLSQVATSDIQLARDLDATAIRIGALYVNAV